MFEVHKLNEQGMRKARNIQANFTTLLETLEDICGPDGREVAIVRTKLEEASFFAKRAMAMRPENHSEIL